MRETILMKIDKLISIIIKGIVFLLPLFFLPLTGEFFEFNKQFLLWLAMPLALFLWLAKQAAAGGLKIKANPVNFPVIIFLTLTFVSALLSLDRFSSFFGYWGRFSDAWLGTLSLAILYFLLINTGVADSAKKIMELLKLFVYSAAVAAALSLLSMMGVIRALAPDSFDVLASPAFNPAGGSLLALAIFLSVAAALAAGLLISQRPKKIQLIFLSAALIMFLAVLALINFSLSWIILFFGLGLLIIFRWFSSGLSLKKVLSFNLIIPAVLILAAVFFLAKPNVNLAKVILGQNLPKEITLGFKPALAVSREVIKNNPVLGSGPGTFARDFSLYRPAEFNQSRYWQIRFDKSASQFLEISATNGLPAALSYLLVVILIIYISIVLLIKYIKDIKSDEDKNYNLIALILTVIVLLFFAQLLFAANTVLIFSFWLFLGLAVSYWQSADKILFKEKIINLNKTILFSNAAWLILLITAAAWLALMVLEIKFYVADVMAAQTENLEKNLNLAIRLNPYRANYSISLAKFYLNQAKADQLNISRAIAAGKRAVAAAPNSVQAQETLGMIYRDIRPLTTGFEPWAVESFSRAYALEPTNPVLAAELAKAYVNINDTTNAEKYFVEAIKLKEDYYDAKFGLAKLYLKEKKDGLGFKLLTELADQTADAEVYYELGRFYYNHKEIDKAIGIFKLALNFSPNHSNSLYSLGIAYEAKGDSAQALKYYEKVLKLNPGNEEVKKKIKNLGK